VPEERVVSLTQATERITLHDVPEGAVPSLLRGFSAPVKLDAGMSRDELAHLMRHDRDLFNRWEAGQQLAQSVLIERVGNPVAALDPLLEEAFSAILADKALDKALAAEALSLPSEEYLAQHMSMVDTDSVYEARLGVRRDLARRLAGQWRAAYEDNRSNEPYVFNAEAAGRRRLKTLALNYLLAADEKEGSRAAMAQFKSADNMTDEQGALTVLSHTSGTEREEALAAFYAKWAEDALVIDKWFNIQARADRAQTLDEVKALLKHPAYEPGNPNRVRSLVAGFAANRKWFHDLSGDGYRFLADQVMNIDKRNPRLSSRLVTAFESWRRFEPRRRALMEAVLQEMRQDPELSRDLTEKVEKFLSTD
jgi:aminopeptidase N